jgi:hypothetical protein
VSVHEDLEYKLHQFRNDLNRSVDINTMQLLKQTRLDPSEDGLKVTNRHHENESSGPSK